MAADGYAWAGYQWENGWPVAAPPRKPEEPDEMQLSTEKVVEEMTTKQPTSTLANTPATAAPIIQSGDQVGPIDALGDRAGSQHGDSTYIGTSYCP